jgi:hypothetical protein
MMANLMIANGCIAAAQALGLLKAMLKGGG